MKKLSFDYAANRYEISGAELNKESLAYLEATLNVLQRHAIVFPELYLDGTVIRAAQGKNTYMLGEIYTQGAGKHRIIYPCFRDQWRFEFLKDISSFLLWKEMNVALRETYAGLEASLLKAEGEGARALINLALLKDFIAMANVGGEQVIQKKQELDFLNGLAALYRLGLAQAEIRAVHGVNLASLVASGTKRRRARVIEQGLSLLVGEEVADIKLYQFIASRSASARTEMDILARYYKRWKGRINTRDDFSSFISSINLWSVTPTLFLGLHQLTAMRELSFAPPIEGTPEWNGMLLSLQAELDIFRKRSLSRILRPSGQYSLELGMGYTISSKVLQIEYAVQAAGEGAFDGVVNVVGHGHYIESGVPGQPEKIAGWIYTNICKTYTVHAFKKLKVINFQACHISQVLAAYVTCLLLEKALLHFEENKIPNVMIVCSPRTPLVLTADVALGRLGSKWQENYLVFPGLVLKALVHLIEQYPNTRLAIEEALNWSVAPPDLNNLSFVDYLRRTHVLAVRRVSARDVTHIDEYSLAYHKDGTGLALKARYRALNECAHLIHTHLAEVFVAIPSLLMTTSIVDELTGPSPLLPVGEVETVRKVVDFLLRLKGARDQRDFLAATRLYEETKVKILIDPYDPVGPLKIRALTDIIFTLCGTPIPASEASYQLAYRKLFLLDKEDYHAMTGISIDAAARDFFENMPYVELSQEVFRTFQVATPQPNMMVVDHALQQSLFGSEQFGVSTQELKAALEGGEETKRLTALDQLADSLKEKAAQLNDSRSLRGLQETLESLNRAKTRLQKKQLSPAVLKSTARVAAGASRLLGAFGVFADFRTQPFHLDFSSAKSGVFTVSDSLAVVKGVFDFTTDIGPVLALRLASSATRALWRPQLDQLFFKLNKVLLPLDVLFTAVSLYRNVEGAQLAKTAEEQALYITMTVVDGAAFGVTLAGFALIGVPGVGAVLVLLGVALAMVNIILNAIVSRSHLENYRWNEKVGLFFRNMFGASALKGILTQQQMRQTADDLFDGRYDPATGQVTAGLYEDGVDLFLTPMINDEDDQDQTNPFKDIGAVSRDPGFRQEPRGYTLSPLGLSPLDLNAWADAKGRGKTEQVRRGWYLRRRETRRGRERRLVVTMPSTPNNRLQLLDFGPISTILLLGATPHLILETNPLGWATGESPEEQARNQYQVKLYPETHYTLQFSKSVLESQHFDSNFGSRTELIVPTVAFQTLPQVSLDLSGQDDARETIAELDLSQSSLEIVKFKDKSAFKLNLVSTDGHTACPLEQVVRTVQLPAHIKFKSGEQHPVMAVVGEDSRIVLRNSNGRSLLLLRRNVARCEIDIQASVGGFAVAI